MRRPNACENLKNKRNSFQSSLFQEVPLCLIQRCIAENESKLKNFPSVASFKMSSVWKNVSIEPGGILDFEETVRFNDSIKRVSAGNFLLSHPGLYIVQIQLHFLHSAQVAFVINGQEQSDSVLGTSGEGGALQGFCTFRTETADSVLSIINPLQNTRPMVVSLYAGGTIPITSDLMIFRM